MKEFFIESPVSLLLNNFTKFPSAFGKISLASLRPSIKIVNGTLLDPSKYRTTPKPSRRDTVGRLY